MWWRDEDLQVIDHALARAGAASPSILTISGSAGMGKSTLLAEIALRATAAGFRVLHAEGEDGGYQSPYSLLRQLGVDDVFAIDGRIKDPLLVVQHLREAMERVAGAAPVLLALDDLQWADRESVETLYWLIQRSAADRILVATGVRRGEEEGHSSWVRLARRPEASRVDLVGLSGAAAAALVGSIRQGVPDRLTARLVQHTDGNPLYLTSLVSQYPPDELGAMHVLPAPTELAQSIRRVLATSSPDAARLLDAVAVLGYRWTPLALAARLAGIAGPLPAADALISARLLDQRPLEPGSPVRIAHTLIRAAVYQTIPLARRRDLHLRAAADAEPMEALEHRVAATFSSDDPLADELSTAAEAAAHRMEFRRAAHLYRWAASVTSDASARSARQLESLFESVLARDLEVVSLELADIDDSWHPVQSALVRGALAWAKGDLAEASVVFATVPDEALAAADGKTRSRLGALHLYARVWMGDDLESLASLIAAATEGAGNPGLAEVNTPILGQLRLRAGDHASMQEAIQRTPADPTLTPIADTMMLAWRGTLYVFTATTDAAERDLAEVVGRVRRGALSTSAEGSFDAFLGFARWQRGEWELAGADFDVAAETSFGNHNPVVPTLRSLVPTIRAQWDEADRLLDHSARQLHQTPWWEAVQIHALTRVVRAHAGGDPAHQAALLPLLREEFGDRFRGRRELIPLFATLHLALAATWAGELDWAEEYERMLSIDAQMFPWTTWAIPWTRALRFERSGDVTRALSLAGEASSAPGAELPLYRAHVWADLGRIAEAAGDSPRAAVALARAERAYRALRATAYTARMEGSDTTSPPAEEDVLAVLSPRERDVAALIVAGLSYAQVARNLYLSRSTVAFHLSNIYAKVGVESRHELTALARR